MTQTEIKQLEAQLRRTCNPAINYAGTEGRKSIFCGGGVWFDVIEYKNGKVTMSIETMTLKKTRVETGTCIADLLD